MHFTVGLSKLIYERLGKISLRIYLDGVDFIGSLVLTLHLQCPKYDYISTTPVIHHLNSGEITLELLNSPLW